ncbi:FAD-dependent monooxygenase [Variovorax sp. PBL-E5]|uniref:FAD-dependent monooxygenase n=1 Tax=Variovorax sp. PBL-E5 TaxID=434014 RepID=UPI0013199E44|nr:FAD-dependent monooxygenase [Variovorax sp. PBL-E5]VTU40248.1 6-hydroxynicotinate 3-monooxygenase precursor [Variovorax sp. PBL-E5]
MNKLPVVVLGAGIGGLAAAAALRRVGTEVIVYEQAARFARVGAGIQQSPNAMKVLRGLGLEQHIRELAFNPRTSLNRDAYSGDTTNEYPLGKPIESRYGAPFLALHRADLHAALASIVPEHCVRLGHKLVGIDQDERAVHLRFANGEQIQAHAVIAADGVHSMVREHVARDAQPPRFTGRVAYRTTFPARLLKGVDIGESRTKWWGEDRHIVIYYVTAQRDEVYFVTSQPEKADWMTKESWSAEGDVDELRGSFARFHPDVRAVLASAPKVHKWGIFERDPMSIWHRGRVTLLGDACHPMTPYMASGAAMALEDAAVLSRCVQEVGLARPDQVFAVFEASRKPRTSQVQAGSSANTWMRNSTNPDWLYGYDAWTVPLTGTQPVAA